MKPHGALFFAALLPLAFAACRPVGGAEDVLAPEDEQWVARQAIERGQAKVVEARSRLLQDPIATGGRIAFDDQRVTHVFSPVTGRVTRVVARLGQQVKKGTPLAVIVSPDVGGAFSDEVKARADLVAAQHEFERQQKLLAEKASSGRDFETAEDNYRKAKAEEERALQRLRLFNGGKIDAVTQDFTLTSHIEGRVVARAVNPGVEVQGQFSGGTAVELFTVGDIERVWLFADVAEAELPDVHAGAEVAARVLAYPDRIFRGKVEWISPTLDPTLRTARLRCSLPNPEGLLKPEMFASVYVERPSLRRLVVPRNAVVRIQEHSFLYVAAGMRPDGAQIFKRRLVQIPERAPAEPEMDTPTYEGSLAAEGHDPDMVPVLAGLAEGEKVLVETAQPRQEGADEVFLPADLLASGKVATVAAGERNVTHPVTVGGRLAFDDLRVTHVFSPVGGRITQLLAGPGQHVKKGTPLALILSPDLGSAFSDEIKAKADLTAAEHETQRQREMYALHASARRDLEVAEDSFNRAKAEYDRAAQKIRLLREGARDSVGQQFVLRSPMDGEVIARMANPGLEIQGQYSGTGGVLELFTIGSIDQVLLLGDIYEVDLPYVKQGAEVELRVSAYPARTFRGAVDWIADTLDPATRTAKVRCVLRNQEGLLRPEMYGTATIAAPARHALLVPRDALLRVGEEMVVFVEGQHGTDGLVRFQRRRVIADEQLPGDVVPVLERRSF